MRRFVKLAYLVAFAGVAGLICSATFAQTHATQSSPTHSASPPKPHCPSPQETAAVLGQASQWMQQGQYQSVITLLQPLAAAGCDARFALFLAGAYEGSGDLHTAEGVLEHAHTRWPPNTSIAASLAREYLDGGDTPKALAALDKFHVTPTTPFQEMEEGALVYIAGHRLAAAQSIAALANQSYPSLRSLLLLANVLQLEGRYKDVNTLMAGKRSEYSESPSFLVTAAESEYDAMLYDGARSDLEHAIALDAGSYPAHFLLGNVDMAQNRTGDAESEYRKAIVLAPNQPRSYYQLALISRARQDDSGEEQLLNQALAADQHYAPAHCELGRIRLNQKRTKDAVDELNRAIQDNPQTEQAYLMLARAYKELGDDARSEAMVAKYKTIRTSNRRSTSDKAPGQMGVGTD